MYTVFATPDENQDGSFNKFPFASIDTVLLHGLLVFITVM